LIHFHQFVKKRNVVNKAFLMQSFITRSAKFEVWKEV
jgi:hypothetical protein